VRFWDASALFPLLVEESCTPTARSLLKADETVYVWWGTLIECAAALARRLREGGLDAEQYRRAMKALVTASDGWRGVAPEESMREDAVRFVRSYPIRAGDALQLAAGFSWARRRPGGHEFVCLDRKLREAAQNEGFAVLPANG
jgi:predicted nucleic acid-binding protein